MVPKQTGVSRRSNIREKKHILIVDDEESLAFFLKQSLLEVDADWRIDTASTAEEAMLKVNRCTYKLVIADLHMPGLSGLDLLQMVRAFEPDTRVILMTAYGSERVEREARRLKIHRYVTKPFRIEDMKEWAREVLETSAPAVQTSQLVGQEKAISHLAQLRLRTGAQYAFIMNMKGRILTSAGVLKDLDVATFAPLIGRGMQAALAAEQVLGAGNSPTIILQSGSRYNVYAANIGDEWVLSIVFDRAAPARRVESILSYIAKYAAEFRTLLAPGLLREPTESTPTEARQVQRSSEAPEPTSLPQKSSESLAEEGAAAWATVFGEGQANMAEWDEALSEGLDSASGSEEGISFEEARRMGLVDEDLLSRLTGKQDDAGI